MKPNYSEPKIYTGGVVISQWNKLSKTEQKAALSKEWYVYYSFKNPDTNKKVRQPNIKGGANYYKTREERLIILQSLQKNLLYLLKKGFDPYKDNTALITKVLDTANTGEFELSSSKEAINKSEIKIQSVPPEIISSELSIRDAFYFALDLKKNSIGKTSYSGLQGRIKRFLLWLDDNDESTANPISTLCKKSIINYLNFVLKNTSARNRNNTRIDLSSTMQVLVNNEIVRENFVTNINTLKATPERNKTYSSTQEHDLLKYLETNDKILLLFIQFITFNFLRPVEVCRLRVRDLDLAGKKLFVRAKNKAVKVKIIPQKLIDLLPNLSVLKPDDYLFTPSQIGGEWDAEENNRRDYFSKRFKNVKDEFKLGKDYGLYI